MQWAGVVGGGGRQPCLALLVLVAALFGLCPGTAAPQQPQADPSFTLTSTRTQAGAAGGSAQEARQGFGARGILGVGAGGARGRREVDLVDPSRALPEVNLDNNTVTEVFFNEGEVALLPCQFPQLSTLHQSFLRMQVSWIRRKDWNILTTGVYTYTNDRRLSVLHQEGSDDWTLRIKYAAMRDNGTYECQMYTGTGVLSQFVNLHVIIPRAAILGPRELHVQEGDTITLICVIQQGRPPFVFWYRGTKMVNYDSRLSVETHVEGTRTHSRLTINHARTWDTGNYSCIPPNVEPSYVLVYVNEANVAAVQRPPSSSPSSSPFLSPLVLAALLLLPLLHLPTLLPFPLPAFLSLPFPVR